MLRTLFFILLPLALLGDARVFLFILNRVVFGSHRLEKSPWTRLIDVVPPILLALTLLFWPLQQWTLWLASRDFVERFTPELIEKLIWSILWAKIGAAWLFIAAGIGLYWILDRAGILLARPEPVRGVLTHDPEVIGLRKAHVPFAFLRKDLLLCGHTHGGQIRFPFFGAVVVPSKYESRYASGFHRVGEVLMYVSRGIGAIPPVRILCRPEIATFVLRQGSGS